MGILSIFNSSRTELSNEDLNRRWLTPKYVNFFFLFFVNHFRGWMLLFLNDLFFSLLHVTWNSRSLHHHPTIYHAKVFIAQCRFFFFFLSWSRYNAHFGRVYSSSYVGYWMQNRPFCVICTVIPVASTPLCTGAKARRVGVQTIGHRKMVKVTILPWKNWKTKMVMMTKPPYR